MQSQLRLIRVLAALSASLPLFAADTYPVDWKQQEAEIFDRYSHLIKLDTSNLPGNETIAAQYLKQVLAKEGIDSQIYELEPGRRNIVARLKGNGSKKPLLLSSAPSREENCLRSSSLQHSFLTLFAIWRRRGSHTALGSCSRA